MNPELLHPDYFTAGVAETDPEIAAAIGDELARQQEVVELIASENIVSRAVLEVQGSVLTNKTVEGYPALNALTFTAPPVALTISMLMVHSLDSANCKGVARIS